ncbi:MAG: hypothetical protein KF868_08150 [Acidobacteria bacterium]|nr:hypothetical protein [Acidobacteriota bacterium]
MALRIFLDIETLPPDETARAGLEADVRRHFLGDERPGGEGIEARTGIEVEAAVETAIEAEVEAEVDRRFRALSLRGEAGRLLAVGMIVERDGEIVRQGVLGRDRESTDFHLDEARTLRGFWRLIEDFDPRRDQIVGHNIFDFDLLFLYQRSVVHRVRPSVDLPSARYRSQPVYDTMREWARWGRQWVSLGDLAEALGLENSKRNGLDGGSVYEYFRAGRCAEIADYCMRDTQLVRSIYYRLNFLN